MYKQARVWLQPGQKQKQNLNRGMTLNHQSKISNRLISRRKSSSSSIRSYIEKRMEQFNSTSQKQNWSDDRWKACLAAGGGSKRRYQCYSDNLGSIVYLLPRCRTTCGLDLYIDFSAPRLARYMRRTGQPVTQEIVGIARRTKFL